jgi:hypothetical protein
VLEQLDGISEMNTLGECHFISNLTILEDFYECSDTAMRSFNFISAAGCFERSLPADTGIEDSASVNRVQDPKLLETPINLQERVQHILTTRPFRWFGHPKHLDSVISACVPQDIKAGVATRSIGGVNYLGKDHVIVTWRGILTK